MVAQDVKGNPGQAISLVQDLRQGSTDYARISDSDLWPDDAAYDLPPVFGPVIM
jgi:hypothetical protein